MAIENAKKFLEELDSNEKALDRLKECGTDLDEAGEISLLGSVARETGYDVTDEELETILKQVRVNIVAAGDQAAKGLEKLPREEIDRVAGGKDHDACQSTYKENENCWVSDKCRAVVWEYKMTEYNTNNEIINECTINYYCNKVMLSPDCTVGRLINHL